MQLPPVQAYSQQSRFHSETVTTLSKDVDLKAVNVTIGDSELLVDSRLWLKAGCHYGMVGRNGVGKSTLLSVIGDKTLVGFPENIRTLYIQQLDVLETDINVIDAVMAADSERQKRMNDVASIERALQSPDELRHALGVYIARVSGEQIHLAQKTATLRSGRRGKTARAAALKAEQTMAESIKAELYGDSNSDGYVAAKVLALLYAELDAMDAHAAEARARGILRGLNISEKQQDQPVSLLSGGWRMRVALAKAMFVQPDILLLDECTNHLDLAAIAWLQDYLVALEGVTIVCVSHDRDFLNAISQEIIRLNDKSLTYHPGNYEDYEQTEDELRKKKERQYASLERRREHVKKSIDNFMKHARSTNDSKVLGQMASRKKKLDRMAGIDKTEDGKRFKLSYWAGFHDTLRPELKLERAEKDVDFSIPQPEAMRHSGPLVSLNGVSFGYSNADKQGSIAVLSNISMSIMMGDHIALLGLNGCGKSTLINIIKGELVPTKGAVEQQARLRIGHYTQHFVDELSGVQESGLAMLMRNYPGTKEGEIRKWLGSFELSGALATRPVHTLSGGQRARMAMAIMLFSNPHLLLLDEVTNHLDMYAVQGLIAAINEYEGTVILVSHDRHFVRETADDIYSLQNGKLAILEEGMDEYIERFISM
ncbi:P-loop containing nucleoside triphosphate hydrolase protein [Kickxella alabastrina]|uniref:P-loop containing nucleoside triphosphate hydrolase protein n=1 Tax=Kickxella alabastrina TaxID=61397 RepID=UPI002220917A|nr:P-loop containing nucleoside triphosphate hydrolase protein [Kickxella alabastrina]KAI7834170.1 P-loop containing nucleoside triphosphate hydrolase protein [Kickxella alabastrina]